MEWLSRTAISGFRRFNHKILINMTNEFLETLGIVIRDQIIMKNSVEIKGLGTFKAVHHNQKQEKKADGTNVMIPPKDTVEFSAEIKG